MYTIFFLLTAAKLTTCDWTKFTGNLICLKYTLKLAYKNQLVIYPLASQITCLLGNCSVLLPKAYSYLATLETGLNI